RQIPQPFVSVPRIKKDNAFACGRMVKGGTRMLRDKFKERLPPGSIGFIKHLVAKLSEFFNADDSDRLCDGLPSLTINSVSVLKFFEWHRPPLISGFQKSELSRLYSTQWNRAKKQACQTE